MLNSKDCLDYRSVGKIRRKMFVLLSLGLILIVGSIVATSVVYCSYAGMNSSPGSLASVSSLSDKVNKQGYTLDSHELLKETCKLLVLEAKSLYAGLIVQGCMLMAFFVYGFLMIVIAVDVLRAICSRNASGTKMK